MTTEEQAKKMEADMYARMEPGLPSIHCDLAAQVSMAISLKRIADALENPEALRLALYNGITEGIFMARPR